MRNNTDDVIFDFFQASLLDDHAKKVILTPNRRLAANLHKQYALCQQNKNAACWETPDILPLSTWLARQWQSLSTTHFVKFPLLLSTHQERALWQNMIAESHGNSLLRINETADKIKSAYELITQWEIDITHPSFQQTEDSIALYHWIIKFNQLCQEKSWITSASLPLQLKNAIQAGQLKPDEYVYLYGFTELSPALQHFLDNYYPYQHIKLKNKTHKQNKQRMTAKNQTAEIYMMAHWAKKHWQQNPNLAIACVFPNLDQIRDRVHEIFTEVFMLGDDAASIKEGVPFNISAGKRLHQYAIIKTALQLLMWHGQDMPIDLFSELIGSPFIGESDSEYLARCYYNVVLRDKNLSHVKLANLLDANHTLAIARTAPRLAARLKQFLDALPNQDAMVTYTETVGLMTSLLSLLGWPGERSLTSHEYQTVENWLKTLSACQAFDIILPPTNLRQALDNIAQATAQSIFQPQTPEVNIQVLGLLEAAGLPFDAVWIAGLDDVTWPPAPKPHPFIPKNLQRQLNMPHATTTRELHFCYKLLAQFEETCAQIIFSYAAKEDNLEKNVSPLIASVNEIAFTDLLDEKIMQRDEIIFESKILESIVDEMGPPLQSEEKVRGGMSILKHQALCPFRAFAQWRLHAHPLDQPYPGLRSKDRGIIIHKALETIWRKLQDHHTLVTMAESELKRLIDEAVQHSLQILNESLSSRPQYLNLESQRMHHILLAWLNIEKTREPFTVLAQEEKCAMSFNNIQLSMRIDRIDQLANGKKLVIDYKTSQSNSIHHWFSDRPVDPQLPLYLLKDITQTVGISFAQILPGNSTFMGVSAADINIKGIRPFASMKIHDHSWDEQLGKWHEVFNKLSHDFATGVAKVDPKEGEQTCHFCALNPLCRISEQQS